jgi:hypothetical protein
MIALLTPSVVKRKSSSDRGQPYLNPLVREKKHEAKPFINTTKETEVKHPIIQFTVCNLKPVS